MSATFRKTLVLAAALGAFALAGHAASASTANSLVGTVGPDFSINLKLGGKPATKLKQGVRYRLVINDRSSIHNFHLRGPGMDRQLTTVGFTGTKSFVVTLKKGTYRFFCDPHASFMRGSFRVA